eukprot:9693135-Alexandrium_andersonii.AAC.1
MAAVIMSADLVGITPRCLNAPGDCGRRHGAAGSRADGGTGGILRAVQLVDAIARVIAHIYRQCGRQPWL